VLDPGAAAERLHWRPERTIDSGLEQTLATGG
jgi:hypothetical protein